MSYRSPFGSRNEHGRPERTVHIAALAPNDAGDVVRDMLLNQHDDAASYSAHASQLSGIISLVQNAMHGELSKTRIFSLSL